MINHLRTLLLDIDGSAGPGFPYPGEEYVPPDFKVRTMPGELRQAWKILFGTNPDRAGRNYRLRQYTALVHGTELAEYALKLDPRITYWPHDPHDERWAAYGATTVTPVGTPLGGLRLIGKAEPDDAVGRLLFEWRIEVLGGDRVQVDDTVYDVVYTAGSSNPFKIGQGLQATVQNSPGDVWFVSSLTRPKKDVGDILASADAGLGASIVTLFGGGEPYDTLGKLWRDSDFLPYRLGALVTALACRIDESRSKP